MKIKLHSSEGGSWLLVGFVVGMVVIVLSIGGCAAYKLHRIQQRNDQRQATNDLYELTNSWNGFPEGYSNVVGICSVISTSAVAAQTPITMRLETSTNLADWETVVEDVEAADADVTLAGAMNNNSNEPARFFRLMQR